MARTVRAASRMVPTQPRSKRGKAATEAIQRGLFDHSEQTLRADEQTMEIKAGLVLVVRSTSPEHSAIQPGRLRVEHVIARHTILSSAPTGLVAMLPPICVLALTGGVQAG